MADYKKRLEKWVEEVMAQGASDLHLMAGSPPIVRVSGRLTPLLSESRLTDEDLHDVITSILAASDAQHFFEVKEFDFSWTVSDKARFRGNAYYERGHIGVALRFVPRDIKTIAELNLPPILEDFSRREQGFFLVVGPVGQGKTTTLAALIEHINQTRSEHIVTVEDPIEYLFENKQSFIDQREVHIDTADFETALQSVFRQDIDVLMIGEMRTPETISTAVTAAETGHLVFSTLHTNSAAQTIDRIIDSFDSAQQEQIRLQLSGSLAAIFSQRLVPRISGGLIPACELLLNTNAVSNLIREKRTHEIQTMIETGSEEGMIDMNRSLAALVRANEISIDTARQYSWSPKTLDRLL